jgi:hypothetical protein
MVVMLFKLANLAIRQQILNVLSSMFIHIILKRGVKYTKPEKQIRSYVSLLSYFSAAILSHLSQYTSCFISRNLKRSAQIFNVICC